MAAVNKCQHLARPAVSLSPLSMDGLRWRDKWHQMVDNFQIVLKRLWNVFYTGIPRFIAHCFVVLCAYCVFLNQWKLCGNPSSLLALFFQQHLLTSCLCHILVTLTYFKLFHYHDICYGDLWSVSFDVTIVIGLGHQELHPHKTMNLIKCCVCSHCPPTGCSQSLPPQASLFLETTILKWSQLIKLEWPLSAQVKGRVV